MQVLQSYELEDRCVYEFTEGAYNHEHWKESSIYIPWENFNVLGFFIEKAIPRFNDYGPNNISKDQWDLIKEKIANVTEYEIADASENKGTDKTKFMEFFNEIDRWVQKCFESHDYFAILGP